MANEKRLIDLLYEAAGLTNNEPPTIEMVADHLIANGVTISEDIEELKTENRILRQKRANIFEIVNAYERGKIAGAGKWIPVSERLPEEYEPVLVYNPNVDHGQTVMEATRSDNGWKTVFDFEAYENNEITHWMPLPEPPKENDYG